MIRLLIARFGLPFYRIHLRHPKRDAIPATGDPIKNAAYQVKNKKGNDNDGIVSDFRRGYNREGSERWGTLSSASSLGRFVELFEVQMTVVIVIYVDFLVSTVQLLPCMQAEALAEGEGRSASSWVIHLIVRLMEVSLSKLSHTYGFPIGWIHTSVALED